MRAGGSIQKSLSQHLERTTSNLHRDRLRSRVAKNTAGDHGRKANQEICQNQHRNKDAHVEPPSLTKLNGSIFLPFVYYGRKIDMTQCMKETVIGMWQEGKTSGQISECLKITRNSVMGIISRARQAGQQLRGGPSNPIVPKARNPAPLARPASPPPVAAKGKRLEDLRMHDCRYIVYTDADLGPVFCADPIEHRSYCGVHAKLCYITPSR